MILKTKADLKGRPDNIIVILGLCFLLIDWLSFGGGLLLKLDVQDQGVEDFWTLMDEAGGRSRKLDNFHGCHMCIVPNSYYHMHYNSNKTKSIFRQIWKSNDESEFKYFKKLNLQKKKEEEEIKEIGSWNSEILCEAHFRSCKNLRYFMKMNFRKFAIFRNSKFFLALLSYETLKC